MTRKRIFILLIALTALYFALPTVSNLIANIVSKNKPAPWESIVGIYFPDGIQNVGIESPRFSSTQQCVNWASGMHSMHKSYSNASNATWICGWGILRYDEDKNILAMRDFIKAEK